MTTEQQIAAAAQAAIASGQGVLSQDAWQHLAEEEVPASSQSSLTARERSESETKQLGRVATSSCEWCWRSGSRCGSIVWFVLARAGTWDYVDCDMLCWHCVQAAAAGAAAAAAISDLFSGTAFEESSLTSLYVFLRQLAWQERRRAGFGCRRRRWCRHSRGRRYAGGTAASSAPLGITECTLMCFSHWT